MTAGEHPSFFVQDQWASGVDVAPEARRHLEACAQCRARAEGLRGVEVTPDWARRIKARPVRAPALARTWVWAAGAGALATAAVLLLLSAPPPDPPTTTIRGAPAVAVYVSRRSHVSLWDGREPLAPGDRLRVEIAGEGFTHATVLAPDARGGLRVLHDARIDPVHKTLLAPAWRVDDAPGDETLVVVLGNRRVAPGEVPGPAGRPRADRWVRWLRLPKRPGGAR